MLSRLDVSLNMDRITKSSIAFMEEKGYTLPTVIMFSNDYTEDILLEYDWVAPVLTDEFGTDSSGDPIYVTIASIRLDGDHGKSYSDSRLYKVASDLCREYSPAGIGLISGCVLRHESKGLPKGPKSIATDPDNITAFFYSFFMPGDTEGSYKLIPYVRVPVEGGGFGDPKYKITDFPLAWQTGLPKGTLFSKNPYDM